MRDYTLGGIYGGAIGCYFGAIVNFLLCYCIVLIPIKIFEKISKKDVNRNIVFFLTSIFYIFDGIFYVYKTYQPENTSLMLYISSKMGAFFMMLSIMLYKKILDNNTNTINKETKIKE